MTKVYRYKMEGSGAGGATFTTSGTINCEFNDAFHDAMVDSFDQLTKGRAVYGKPGAGCRGPYDIHKVVIEQVRQ
jgi:hypothetical protein